MKTIFIGGALDHINLPLCKAFFNELNSDFKFVATKSRAGSRMDLGYGNLNEKYPFVIDGFSSQEQILKAKEEIFNADTVIFGSAPENLVKDRMRAGKLTFRFTERLYKEPSNFKNFAYRYLSAVKHHGRYQKKNVYILCAGAYVYNDFSRFGYYKDKCFKWCYFTQLTDKSLDELLIEKEKNERVELVWTARFVELKHPEKVVNLAHYLKSENLNFHINMIGGGDLLQNTKNLVAEKGLEDYITFTGALTPEKTREYMEKADVSLFTSDRREGWGAVVNEAMGCACALVASSAAGSSPLLIENYENGLLFDIDDEQDFLSKVKTLIVDERTRRLYAEKAYNVIHSLWSPKNAAISFIKLSKSILSGKVEPMKEGPCSFAPILKDGWIKNEKR